MIVPAFTGKVFRGQPLFDETEGARYHQCMRGLEGREIEILIRKKTPWSSTRQKRFYHGIVIPLVLEARNLDKGDHAEVDAEMRQKFLGPDEDGYTRSISDLTTTEFEDFMEQIRALMAPDNIIIPRPNEADIYEKE